MKNKEKAREIADRHSYVGDDIEYDDLIDACKEMAEWKDHQFKEYLEKKRDSITNYAQARMYAPIYNEIINEFFKK